jgi:hypothetical protein
MQHILPDEMQAAMYSEAHLCAIPDVAAQMCQTQWGQWFKRLAETLWPKKPSACLQYHTGAKDRAARYWTSGREWPAWVLVVLLRSAEGDRVLELVMRGSKAKWWAAHRDARKKAAFYDQHITAIAQLNRQLELPLA